MKQNEGQASFYDVDGTIIDGQTQRYFLKYLLDARIIGRIPYLKILCWFLLYKLGIINDPRRVMRYGYSFIRGRSVEEISRLTNDFFETVLRKKIYPEAEQMIRVDLKDGKEVVLVSNSIDIIVGKLAEFLHASNFICSNLEIKDGKYTGIVNVSAYGNKGSILTKYLIDNGLRVENTWAFSDHQSDVSFLAASGHAVAVNPTNMLRRIAMRNGWDVKTFLLK